jgi:hypothetical protein
LSCGRELGFLPDAGRIGTFETPAGAAAEFRTPVQAPGSYRKCDNYEREAVCNWMVRAEDSSTLCQSCRLNAVIPDLTVPENRTRWASAESAKRRLIYSLNRLGLPVVPKSVDTERGLSFDLKNEGAEGRVLTGHADGLITLNLKEADPVLREKARLAMRERYRTLLGHFRHEIGHYYWTMLVQGTKNLDRFRELFGDERTDYAQALELHYSREASQDWHGSFVSAYATAHPWEDWAESWAHYLHMVDTLETARAYQLNSPELVASAEPTPTFEILVDQWRALSVILNALSRSMGHEDLSPFEIGDGAKLKLAFIHEVITSHSSEAKAGDAARAP